MVKTIKIITEKPTSVGGASFGFGQTIEKSVQERSHSIHSFEKENITKIQKQPVFWDELKVWIQNKSLNRIQNSLENL